MTTLRTAETRTAETRVAALEAENAELRERLAFYRLTVFGEDLLFPPTWRLSRAEERLLAALLSPLAYATHEALLHALYPGGADDEPDDGLAVVKSLVFRLRRKLLRLGVVVHTVWGRGYVIHEPCRGELRRAARQASRPPWEQPAADCPPFPSCSAARLAAPARMAAAR